MRGVLYKETKNIIVAVFKDSFIAELKTPLQGDRPVGYLFNILSYKNRFVESVTQKTLSAQQDTKDFAHYQIFLF